MTWAFALDSVPFTKDVIAGRTSLGGSESACLGLMRALAARGHTIHAFTTKLADDAHGRDHAGVIWHSVDDFWPMNEFIEWDVCVSLRWFGFFGVKPIQARLRLMWNQDLLVPGQMQAGVMACAWAYDQLAYVSQYHRDQWEDLQPELAPIGWVTRNGIDLSQVPRDVVKDSDRLIHISRPERGLGPLLTLWPLLKAKHPTATLRICRYSSMYDEGGWGQVCKAYDEAVARVNADVGGITYLGELNKPDLYREISAAAAMWYPGVATFAETNCIAATEANACGTPFVGSLKGALVETAKPSYEAGLLIPGDAEHDPAYAEASVAAVLLLLDGCRRSTVAYRRLQTHGRALADSYGYDTLAAEWEAHIEASFCDRYSMHTAGVLRQLIHEDDYTAARLVATDGSAARALCDEVIHGKHVTPEDYAIDAIQDPLYEADLCSRFHAAAPLFAGCTHVLDVACGNGSFAIVLARLDPDVRVHGLDYSADNIAAARGAAARAGVADRVTYEQCTVYDFETQAMHADWEAFTRGAPGKEFGLYVNSNLSDLRVTLSESPTFDGLFVGEFIEHIADTARLVDELETVLAPGSPVVYTCPSGAFDELRERGASHKLTHVHRFHHDDIKAVFGKKRELRADYLSVGWSPRGHPIGNWMIQYRFEPGRPAAERPLWDRIARTRPMPKLSVGLIVKDVENDLGRCLTSVWKIADEIVVGDTGSTDRTVAIAESYGARVISVAPIAQQPEGFAGARNAVLRACTGDWFLWIDADEVLVGSSVLRRYLEGHVFNGFVLHQNHLQLDAPQQHDIPIRVFRRVPDVQFYGCVHEQPQWGDANTDIHPALDATDVQIAHTGYLTEGIRRDKMMHRNMPLIIKDQQVFPQRQLGKVILIRESVLQANRECETVGAMTAKAQRGYGYAIGCFREHFSDPANKYHAIARPWYELALKALGMGWEVELALAGRKGGLENRSAKPERIWVADSEEFACYIQHRSGEIAQKMRPTVFHTDPFITARVEEAEALSA